MRNQLWRLLAIVAFGSAITSVSARADDEGYYTFTSALSTPNSSFCLNVPGSDYQPGKRVALIGCTKTPSQIFELANGSNLTAGGLCLDGLAANRGQPPAAGDPVGLAECDGSDHQVWELDPFTSNASLFAIVDPNGLCVTVDGPTAAPGTLLVLAQCAEMQNQGWVQGGAARPMPVAQGGTYVGGYGGYAEPEYYWYSGHRYCWYDGGWHGAGWYWCGDNFHNGIGWGGPIGWHFWFHFGHKWLPHPVSFKSYLGKPPHKHDVLAIQKNKGFQGAQGGKGNQGGQAGKGNQGAQGGQGGQGGGQGGKGGKGKSNKSAQGGQGAGGRGGGGGGGGGAGAGKQKTFRATTSNKGGGGGGGGGGGNKGGGGGNKGGGNKGGGNKGGGGGGGGGKGGGGGGGGKGGGGGGGGGNKGKHPSDIRLKQDIVPLARLESGIELYRFRYKGSDPTAYVGVMAQEAQTVMPSAVSLGRNGYLQVDYGRLGLKFMTWDSFVQRHGAELRRAD